MKHQARVQRAYTKGELFYVRDTVNKCWQMDWCHAYDDGNRRNRQHWNHLVEAYSSAAAKGVSWHPRKRRATIFHHGPAKMTHDELVGDHR